jgi:hypothetical protein
MTTGVRPIAGWPKAPCALPWLGASPWLGCAWTRPLPDAASGMRGRTATATIRLIRRGCCGPAASAASWPRIRSPRATPERSASTIASSLVNEIGPPIGTLISRDCRSDLVSMATLDPIPDGQRLRHPQGGPEPQVAGDGEPRSRPRLAAEGPMGLAVHPRRQARLGRHLVPHRAGDRQRPAAPPGR